MIAPARLHAYLCVMPMLLLLLAAAALVAVWLWRRSQRRGALLSSPLPQADRARLERLVPMVRRLPPELHAPLEGKVNLFLDQVDFIGCDGLEVTEDMRLAIAGQACLLVVNAEHWYDTLRTILIYPGPFKSRLTRHEGYVVTERDEVRLGESWARGPVILSWPHSEQGAIDQMDGHNVVLHEFAHQIDALSGNADGAPLMNKDQSFEDWSRVFLEAYAAHLGNLEAGRPTVFDPYGATAHEEFFAVAVELFFEKPGPLRHEAPEVYDQLKMFFRLDPISWG